MTAEKPKKLILRAGGLSAQQVCPGTDHKVQVLGEQKVKGKGSVWTEEWQGMTFQEHFLFPSELHCFNSSLVNICSGQMYQYHLVETGLFNSVFLKTLKWYLASWNGAGISFSESRSLSSPWFLYFQVSWEK